MSVDPGPLVAQNSLFRQGRLVWANPRRWLKRRECVDGVGLGGLGSILCTGDMPNCYCDARIRAQTLQRACYRAARGASSDLADGASSMGIHRPARSTAPECPYHDNPARMGADLLWERTGKLVWEEGACMPC